MGTAEKRERIRSLMKRSVRESSYSEVLTPKLYAIFLAHAYFSRKRILSFQYVSRGYYNLSEVQGHYSSKRRVKIRTANI